jgi:signal transduction histidine kinase
MLTLKKEVIEKKKKKIKNVVNKMVAESDDHYVYTRKRLNYLLMDSLLRNSFNERDITLPYEYSVVTDSTERMETSSTPGFDKNTEYRKYETVLFPNDIVPKTDKIVIYFPERQKHLIKSLSVLLPSSLFFSLIIIVAFSISITMVLKQKKISDIKTDFINNMTHEFKTPIATISLAADTIVNPKMIGDTDKIKQFIGIIKDENKRMNMQVERILQMAQLDKKEMELNFELLDVHILILRAIGNIDIQLKQLNGKISTKLEALDSFVSVDEIHFINIVNNLLDNALKYTDNAPEILVSSSQLGNGILLSFWDKGFGMSKEVQGRIFEKFYRVTKGNIHNIKGFGLGLSYVKAIVELHGGRISVKSEQNKGSRFDIFLPQKNKENGKQI